MVGSKEHVVPISECCEHQIDVLLVVNVSMVLAIYSQFFWLLTLVVCGPSRVLIARPRSITSADVADPWLRTGEAVDNLHLAMDPS